jgi:hypothetical protein
MHSAAAQAHGLAVSAHKTDGTIADDHDTVMAHQGARTINLASEHAGAYRDSSRGAGTFPAGQRDRCQISRTGQIHVPHHSFEFAKMGRRP